MCFSSILISSLLLASSALASPFESRAQQVDALQSYTRAGVMIGRNLGIFRANTGTITTPGIEGLAGASLFAWVGIDSDNCNNFFRAGVAFTASPPAYTVRKYQAIHLSYPNVLVDTAWYQWVPSPRVYVENFTISVGDEVRFWVGVYGDTMSSGYVMVAHTNDLQGGRNYFVEPGCTLCGKSAEWILGDDTLDKGLLSQARVGALAFTNAVASGPDNQTYGPLNGDIIEMVNSDHTSPRPVAFVSDRNEDSLTITNPL